MLNTVDTVQLQRWAAKIGLAKLTAQEILVLELEKMALSKLNLSYRLEAAASGTALELVAGVVEWPDSWITQRLSPEELVGCIRSSYKERSYFQSSPAWREAVLQPMENKIKEGLLKKRLVKLEELLYGSCVLLYSQGELLLIAEPPSENNAGFCRLDNNGLFSFNLKAGWRSCDPQLDREIQLWQEGFVPGGYTLVVISPFYHKLVELELSSVPDKNAPSFKLTSVKSCTQLAGVQLELEANYQDLDGIYNLLADWNAAAAMEGILDFLD